MANMKIKVNKEAMVVPENFTLSMLLKQRKLGSSVAVFINGKQLLMKEYDTYVLQENDDIKIIRPIGGG